MTDKEIIQALRICSRRTDAQTCAECPLFDSEDCRGDMMVGAADLIERLTAENTALREKVPQWISVEERRPEPGKRVLATDGVFVGEAYRTSADTWRRYDGIAMRDCLGSVVTHWLPPKKRERRLTKRQRERLLKAEILRRCTPLYAFSPEMQSRIVREYLAYD